MDKKMITYLTTKDNPWNPFDNWDEWYAYDMAMGYDTCGHIDRLAPTSEALPDSINIETIQEAHKKLISIGAVGNNGRLSEYVEISKEIDD